MAAPVIVTTLVVAAVAIPVVVPISGLVIDAGCRIAVSRISLDVGWRWPLVVADRIGRHDGAGAQAAEQRGGEADTKGELLEVHDGDVPCLHKVIIAVPCLPAYVDCLQGCNKSLGS